MRFKIQHIFNTTSLRTAVTLLLVIVGINFSITAGTDAKRKSNDRAKATSEFTVVIDAGHGGHDHGAVDNGATEKTINLGVAKKLASLVRKKLKDVKVVMTRDDDTFISFQERANIANRNKGNLFISIHTNSVDKSNPNRKTVAGTSVYALGPQKDANNLKVAQRENSVIELEDNYHVKYSGFDPSKDESYIIFEMAQKKNLGQSLKFADKAQKELVKTASRKDRGVKQAGFWVLWATSMPSVLVELDFICNPTQAKYLSSDNGQQELAQALFNALESYIKSCHNPKAVTQHMTQSQDFKQTNEADIGSDGSLQSSGGVSTLVSSQQDNKQEKMHVAKARTNKNTYVPRKRRSGNARKISDNRDVETESIMLKSETDFLAIQESKKDDVKVVESDENSKDSDKQSKRKKKKKNKKDNNSNKKKKEITSNARPKSGKKTFVVKNNSSGKSVNSKQTAEFNSASAAEQSKTTTRMVYKIQLIASEKELAKDAPSFCGLVPTGMFKENGYYKYTYGASENRREIEKKLLEVKTLIPDAVIVVSIE